MHGGGTRRTGNLDDGIVAVVELRAEGLRHHRVLEVQRRDVGELEDGHLVEVTAELGEEVGAGVTRKITSSMEIYAEIRDFHGSHGGVTTDLRPITIGVRW